MPVRIQVSEYFIQLLADPRDQTFVDLLSVVRGIEKMRKRDTYRCSLRKLPEVLKQLRGIDSPDQVPDGLVKNLFIEELDRRKYTQTLKELGPDMTSDWLWKHQCLGIELAQINRRYNFFYDTRTGKTLMMLRIMHDRLVSGEAKRCLVICPSAIVKAWLNDATKHFPQLKIAAVYGDAANRFEALHKPAHIVIWSTEQVASNMDILSKLKFDCCVFDESSKIKDYSTKIAAAAQELSLLIPSWYNLSATPAPNGKHEYYTQMMCLDPYVFCTARTHFKERYFDDKSRSKNYEKLVIKANMEDEFMATIEDYSLYVDQAVMPTAGKEWHTVEYSLEPELEKAYATMCSDMYSEVNGIIITAEQAATMRGKLNQLASGFIMDTEAIKTNKADRRLGYEQESREIYRIGNGSRINCMRQLLEKLGNAKCVIWANYTEEFRMLEELLGVRARYIRGGTSVAEKEQYIYQDFKAGSLQYLVCHPLSVGMGINLTQAHIAIYYSMSDSWEAFKQSSERIYGHLATQPFKCEYYILQAKNTVNELIYGNVVNKRDSSTDFLDHLKTRALT